tara:strand:- start:150 stop:353 length:204 start_codon:yes stop_codon:yes gene_type:complete
VRVRVGAKIGVRVRVRVRGRDRERGCGKRTSPPGLACLGQQTPRKKGCAVTRAAPTNLGVVRVRHAK